ncbi:DUF6397 family protein, partial [Streptomyces sp. B1866]|uniref:DUF6397 family protein n=1 Tax=Streptomyces sp. B1866 TaxID=3075431 RepID=UPI0028921697
MPVVGERREAREGQRAEQRPRSGPRETVALGTAARQLGLGPREFDLAVCLGEVRTTAVAGAGRRVARAEIDRVLGAPGFPGALMERLKVVGTAAGAEALGVSPGRFTRLARAGYLVPVRCYVNRYRALVWLYAAAELADLAERRPDLLAGRAPEALRALLAAGADRRARTWRARRVAHLLRQADDPWRRAAVWAAVLAPDDIAAAVPDPAERALVQRLAPDLGGSRAQAPAVRAVMDGISTADGPQEAAHYRSGLAAALDGARRSGPPPRPQARAPRG